MSGGRTEPDFGNKQRRCWQQRQEEAALCHPERDLGQDKGTPLTCAHFPVGLCHTYVGKKDVKTPEVV